jgi:hypothetical protein
MAQPDPVSEFGRAEAAPRAPGTWNQRAEAAPRSGEPREARAAAAYSEPRTASQSSGASNWGFGGAAPLARGRGFMPKAARRGPFAV